MNAQTRFLMFLSVILFLAIPVYAAESIITEGINNTVTTTSDTSSGGSSDGTYPRNYGSGGGFYRTTPTPVITDMPVVFTDETPAIEATQAPMPIDTPVPTETVPEMPGFSGWLAVMALFGLCVLIRKH